MDKQPFIDVSRVKEIDGTAQVNKLLAAGWKLITTRKTVWESGNEEIAYVLGWPSDLGTPVDPIADAEQKRFQEMLNSSDETDGLLD